MGLPEGYRGFRFRHFKWFVWDEGLLEAYRLGSDPYELTGVALEQTRGSSGHMPSSPGSL